MHLTFEHFPREIIKCSNCESLIVYKDVNTFHERETNKN